MSKKQKKMVYRLITSALFFSIAILMETPGGYTWMPKVLGNIMGNTLRVYLDAQNAGQYHGKDRLQ